MHITVKKVLELDIMKDAIIKTGLDQLNKREVKWVSVIETPVENFVRKDEFVLSTGIGCGDDEELFCQFVKEVIDSEASALAIASGRYVHHIPDSVIDIGKKHQFPLILLPWEIRFGDIIQSIIKTMNRQKEELVENSEEIQQKLLHLILKNGDLSDIANFVYKTIKKPVIITDKRGHIKGKSKKAANLIEDWNQYLHSEEYAISLLPFESNQHITSPNIRYITINDHSIMQMMIQSSSETQGYLIIGGQTNDTFEHTSRSSTVQLLEHAATAVALCFLRENTVRETEMRLKDDFVWSLAKGEIKSWEYILSRAKSLNYNVNLPYICLIGYPENFEELYKKNNPEKISYEHWLQNIIRRMEDEIFYASRTIYCQTLTTFQKDQFIIFLEVNNTQVEEKVFPFLDILKNQFQQMLPELILSWGIGKTAGLKCFHDSYQEAQSALDMGKRQKGPGHVSTYADTRLDRALMTLITNQELKKITDTTIGALLHYDQERGIDLINTYITYSRNRGNVSQTARQLSLHRQSLLYRLRKIEALTDCSLENPDDVFLLDLSIKLWTIGILDQK